MVSRTGSLVLGSLWLAGCATTPTMDLEQLADELAGCDVVFLGEQHDNAPGHAQHEDLVQLLYARRPELVIALEMFERDVQGAVDDYLAGRIEEEEFLEASRPWRTYRRFYRPLVEFAKAHGLQVVAANAPDALVKAMRRGEELDEADREFVAVETSAPKDAYWTAFIDAMGDHAGVDSDTMMPFYRAQCLRDDTMAEAVVAAFEREGATPLVVLKVGGFHVEDGLGAAARVAWRRPDLKLAVVSMEDRPNVSRLASARYSLLVPAQPELPRPEATPDPDAEPADPHARPGLGFHADYAAEDGVPILALREGGPAARAGLLAGDVIVRFDDADVTDFASYMEALNARKIGDEAEVTVDRGGKLVTVTVEIGESRR